MIKRHWLIITLMAALVLSVWLGWLRSSNNHAPPADQVSTELTANPMASASPSPSSAEVEIAASPLPVEDDWTRRWHQAEAMADEAQRNQAKEALIEALAMVDSLRAVELARNEAKEDLRLRFLEAAMRGWGQTNPEAALAWAATQQLLDSGQAMASIFHGAARDPENAIRLAKEMSERDPQHAGDYGSYLVAALTRGGEFGKAADFAAHSTGETRVNLLNATYSSWADKDPQAALADAAKLTDPETLQTASNAILSRWAHNDAAAVAEYAVSLKDQKQQQYALAAALPAWAAADPVKAATWLNQFGSSPVLDSGVASIATQPEVVRQPEVAFGWAQSIVDARLRGQVMASVIYSWAKVDPSAAKLYAEESPDIRPEDRPSVLLAFEQGFEPVSLVP